jgi:hypothetical protein
VILAVKDTFLLSALFYITMGALPKTGGLLGLGDFRDFWGLVNFKVHHPSGRVLWGLLYLLR